MKKFIVQMKLDHNGVGYEIGEKLSEDLFSDEELEALLLSGTLKEVKRIAVGAEGIEHEHVQGQVEKLQKQLAEAAELYEVQNQAVIDLALDNKNLEGHKTKLEEELLQVLKEREELREQVKKLQQELKDTEQLYVGRVKELEEQAGKSSAGSGQSAIGNEDPEHTSPPEGGTFLVEETSEKSKEHEQVQVQGKNTRKK